MKILTFHFIGMLFSYFPLSRHVIQVPLRIQSNLTISSEIQVIQRDKFEYCI